MSVTVMIFFHAQLCRSCTSGQVLKSEDLYLPRSFDFSLHCIFSINSGDLDHSVECVFLLTVFAINDMHVSRLQSLDWTDWTETVDSMNFPLTPGTDRGSVKERGH